MVPAVQVPIRQNMTATWLLRRASGIVTVSDRRMEFRHDPRSVSPATGHTRASATRAAMRIPPSVIEESAVPAASAGEPDPQVPIEDIKF